MSQQLQITGGAKVRSLEGVITGSTGVLGSLPINGSNGIPQLDVNGKILVSQLPNSVMEYLGTWNAATNTPTLVNGTGNAGDVYLCNVAGTVNFGAGPITFGVGDQVIYSGTIWQKAGGSTGTVTSVAVTESGDALSITGSPITTSGTINIGFAGTSAQYVAGDGTLVTFPTFSGFVPYTGATANVDLGTFDLTTDIVNLNQLKAIGSGGLNIYSNSGTHIALMGGGGGAGTTFYGGIIGTTASFTSSGSSNTFDITHSSGSGIALNITKGGSGEGLYINKTSGSGNALTVLGTTSISGQLTLGSTITNGTYTYTLPGATGVLALTSDLTIYVTLSTLQTITGTKIYSSLQYFDNNVYIKHGISGSSSGYTTLGANASGLNINLASGTSNNSLNFASTSASNTYTFPNATGTVALTSDLSGYISGSGSSGRIPYFSGTSSVTSTSNLTWDNTGNFISTSGVYVYNTSTNAYMLTSNGDNIGSVFNVSTTRWGLGYGSSTSSLATAVLSWNDSGNVSIGNTNNTYNLDVTGTGRFTGALIANSFSTPATGTAGSTIWSLLHDQYVAGDFGIYTPSNARIYINASGQIGINNTSPSYTLDVTGTGRFTGNVGIGMVPNERLSIAGSSGLAGMIRWTDSATCSAFLGITSGGVAYIHSNNNSLAFGANGSNNFAETMRITGGFVGIATTDPIFPLRIAANYNKTTTTGSAQMFISTNEAAASSPFGLRFQVFGGASTANRRAVLQTTDYNSADGGIISLQPGGGQITMGSTASLYGGVILSVKQTTANNTAEIWSNSASDSGRPALILIKNDNVSSSSQVFQRFAIDNANSANGQINGNGAAQVAFGSWSDKRLKHNIVDLPSQLSNIMALRPVEFDYKNGIGHQIGFIAQEMQEVYPDVVCEDTDGYLTITGWSKTEARLIKAIQELKLELDELKAKIK